MKKINWILISLTITAFILVFVFVDTSYFFWDESVYLLMAQFFKYGHAPYLELTNRPPLLPFIIFPFSSNLILMKGFLALLNSLIVPLAYIFGKEINKKTALLAAVFVTFVPFSLLSSRWVMTDSLGALLLILTLFLYWIGLTKKSPLMIYLGGISIALSILMKFTNLLVIILLLPLLIYLRKKNIRYIGISLLLCVISMLPYFIFNYIRFNSFLYPFYRAFHPVIESQPVTLLFTAWSIYDFLGPILLILFVFGLFYIIKKEKKPIFYFMLYWGIILLSYYIYIVQKGVAKPPTIEFEVERFLLPALIPMVIIASYALKKVKAKYIIFIFLLFLVFNIGGYTRAYTPAINYENRLREITKEIGLYIKNEVPENSTIYCTFNCPPIAYYSQRETKIITIDNIEINNYPENSYFLTISQFEPDIKLNKTKTIKTETWIINLYRYR